MTTPPRSPRLLVLSTVVLAVCGVALLAVPHGQEQPAPGSSPVSVTGVPSSAAAAPSATAPTIAAAPSKPSGASPSPVVPSALPPHGEGAAGDEAIQQSLEASWPADLPAADERELLTTGRALLRADVTGVGREKWPELFPHSPAVAPAFTAARFRIQAAIARQDGRPNRAVVHLVWAGMDRGGTFTDLRITDWHFTRTTTKGAPAWTPQPRT
ncbi:hypothetical protein [Streptomyces sp. NBC_00140]|uniref:hypothetical protein n=1 Tax=Streptomyces sp. NBC_00140 TaxID=2975664 RepID=UPI00225805D7|nr:hypothetical protein [Streptomyces sp. NBC_00140]MCX5327795.1 hypothetical protein [Streptomyces sp. NBC_00140]MCX5336838.1 hypothetical protein [Streptomyces sp. NBC_00140]